MPSHQRVNLPATPAPRGALDNEELFIVEEREKWRKMRQVAQRECPLSPAITESEAPPPLKRMNWSLQHGLSLNTKDMSTTLSGLQLWELDCLPQLCTYNTTTTESMYCNKRNTGTDHRNLPLRRDRGGDDITTKTAHLAMHNHGHVNQVEEHKQPRLCMSTGTSTSTSTAKLSAPTAGATGSGACASCTTTSRAPDP